MATRKPPNGKESLTLGRGNGARPGAKGPPGRGDGREARNDARRAALKSSRDLSAKLHGATLVQKSERSATLFQVEMPSLDEIEVVVDAPEAVSEADIAAYVDDIVKFSLKKSPRLAGESVALDDEILVDSTGYCRGVVFSAQADQWLTMRENPLLPTLFDQLVGLGVGESTVINLRLPENYPDDDFSNSLASFAVHIKEAMKPPSDIDRDELMRELNYGNTWKIAKEKLRGDLEEALATELVVKAKEKVLEELESRGKDEVPKGAIDAYLADSWRETDGKGLAKAGVDFDAQQTALKAFQETEENRIVAQRELWRASFLEQAAKHFDIKVDQTELRELMQKAAGAMGLDPALVDGALTRMEALSKKLMDEMRLSRAFDLVLEKTKISFQ